MMLDAHILAQIVEIQKTFLAELEPTAVMRMVVQHAQTLTGATGALVELIDGDELVHRAVSGSVVAHLGTRLPRAFGLSGMCVATGEVVRCDDAATDPRVDPAACQREGWRSALVVPLVSGAKIMGLLKVLSGQPAAFSAAQVPALQLMGGFITLALRNASLYDEACLRGMHDPLTGLPNRVLFRDRLAHALARLERRSSAVAVICLDLEGFASVNEQFARPTGEDLLRQVADRLRRATRSADTPARLAEDEFAVVVDELDSSAITELVAARVSRAVSEQAYTVAGHSIHICAGVGFATATGRRYDADTLLAEAKAAMHPHRQQLPSQRRSA